MTAIDIDGAALTETEVPASPPGDAPLPPGPRGRESLRWLQLLAEQEGPLDFLDRMGYRYGDVATMRTRLHDVAVVRGPEAVRHVLLGNQDNYRKSSTSCWSRFSARAW